MVAPVDFHLLIDPLGRAAQREFAKRDQIAFGKEILNRMLDLLRNVHLPVSEPLKKIVGREVGELSVSCPLKNGIRARLAHPHAGNLRHHIIQAFQMLHVHGGIDRNASLE